MPLTHEDALNVIAANRGNRVAIPSMGSVAIWPGLSDTGLDFSHIPSSMGQAPALGLGLALAQPQRGVVVMCGDGSLLMNLGCLVTIADHPANLWLILIDNGLYEVTGGQPVAGSGHTDFSGLARAAGIQRVYSASELSEWQRIAPEVFAGDGPVFVCLRVEGRYGQKTPVPPRSMSEQIQRLRSAINAVE